MKIFMELLIAFGIGFCVFLGGPIVAAVVAIFLFVIVPIGLLIRLGNHFYMRQ